MSKFKTKEFEELKSTWYAKLKAEGFVDVERDEEHLNYDVVKTRRFKVETAVAKQEYYNLASQFLWEHPFNTEFEKQVWALHVEGISYTDIVAVLKSKGLKTYRSQVQLTMEHLTRIMIGKCQSKK